MSTQMIARFFEDGMILVRFVWFFYRAPKSQAILGFTATGNELTTKARMKWAWQKSMFQA